MLIAHIGNNSKRQTSINKPFATVRHRTIKTKVCLSCKTTLIMAFKLVITLIAMDHLKTRIF